MIKLDLQLFSSDEQMKLNEIFEKVNSVLDGINTKDITAESSDQFVEIPDGYYLAEVEKVELQVSKSSGNPMVAWQMKVVEDGIRFNEDLKKVKILKTVNKKKFMYSSLKDTTAVERFISDALKFEGEEKGKPYLEKEYFTTAETLSDALQLLVGKRIWLHVDTNEAKDGTTSTWTRFISWARAIKLELEQE